MNTAANDAQRPNELLAHAEAILRHVMRQWHAEAMAEAEAAQAWAYTLG